MQRSSTRLSQLMQLALPAGRRQAERGIQRLFSDFHQTELIIGHIRQLIGLLADIQRHRACSLAILSGNLSFEPLARSLQRKIRARLDFLDSQNDLRDVIEPRQWQYLLNEWHVVGYGWRQDNVLHNFELHAHLIEKLINIVREAGRRILDSDSCAATRANTRLSPTLTDFLFFTHLYQLETLGRLRGLGTHLAQAGHQDKNCIDDKNHCNIQSRVRFLLHCAQQEQAAAQALLATEPETVTSTLPAVQEILHSQPRLQRWFCLLAEIADGQRQPSDQLAQEHFRLASAVIDGRLALTGQVLSSLQLALEEGLEVLLEDAVRHG